jgi:hypothetical protein
MKKREYWNDHGRNAKDPDNKMFWMRNFMGTNIKCLTYKQPWDAPRQKE